MKYLKIIFFLSLIKGIGNTIMYFILYRLMKYINQVRNLFNWKLSLSVILLEVGIFLIPYYAYFYQISKRELLIFFVIYTIFILSYIIFAIKYINEKGLNESILEVCDIKNESQNVVEFKELRHDVTNYIETLKILQENKERK